jgi:hypothetical protein
MYVSVVFSHDGFFLAHLVLSFMKTLSLLRVNLSLSVSPLLAPPLFTDLCPISFSNESRSEKQPYVSVLAMASPCRLFR